MKQKKAENLLKKRTNLTFMTSTTPLYDTLTSNAKNNFLESIGDYLTSASESINTTSSCVSGLDQSVTHLSLSLFLPSIRGD